MINLFKNRYRVVSTKRDYFVPEKLYWFFPFWIQMGDDEYSTSERAEGYIRTQTRRKKVVKYVKINDD